MISSFLIINQEHYIIINKLKTFNDIFTDLFKNKKYNKSEILHTNLMKFFKQVENTNEHVLLKKERILNKCILINVESNIYVTSCNNNDHD